jgi:CheY-like chemotaxis protein
MWNRIEGATPVVLVVEDDWMIRAEIVEAFLDAEFIVLEADSAVNAIAFLDNSRHVDVIFTDIRLKGVGTGWDIADAYRAIEPEMPVVYASGQSSDPLRRVGNSLFFSKPYVDRDVVGACLHLIGLGDNAGAGHKSGPPLC